MRLFTSKLYKKNLLFISAFIIILASFSYFQYTSHSSKADDVPVLNQDTDTYATVQLPKDLADYYKAKMNQPVTGRAEDTPASPILDNQKEDAISKLITDGLIASASTSPTTPPSRGVQNSTPSPDNTEETHAPIIFFKDEQGQLILPTADQLEKSSTTRSQIAAGTSCGIENNHLHFRYNTNRLSANEIQVLQGVATTNIPKLDAIMGGPLFSDTIIVTKDTSSRDVPLSLYKYAPAYYVPFPTPEIHFTKAFDPDLTTIQGRIDANNIFTHEIAHAYHGIFAATSPPFEEGIAHFAEQMVTQDKPFHADYDYLNVPELSFEAITKFDANGSGFSYTMGANAFHYAYDQDPTFIKNYNCQLLKIGIRRLEHIGNLLISGEAPITRNQAVEAIINTPGTINGLSKQKWIDQQHVLTSWNPVGINLSFSPRIIPKYNYAKYNDNGVMVDTGTPGTNFPLKTPHQTGWLYNSHYTHKCIIGFCFTIGRAVDGQQNEPINVTVNSLSDNTPITTSSCQTDNFGEFDFYFCASHNPHLQKTSYEGMVNISANYTESVYVYEHGWYCGGCVTGKHFDHYQIHSIHIPAFLQFRNSKISYYSFGDSPITITGNLAGGSLILTPQPALSAPPQPKLILHTNMYGVVTDAASLAPGIYKVGLNCPVPFTEGKKKDANATIKPQEVSLDTGHGYDYKDILSPYDKPIFNIPIDYDTSHLLISHTFTFGPPNPDFSQGPVGLEELTFNDSYSFLASVNIVDGNGKLVKTLATNQASTDTIRPDSQSSTYTFRWDGTDQNGKIVAKGLYFYTYSYLNNHCASRSGKVPVGFDNSYAITSTSLIPHPINWAYDNPTLNVGVQNKDSLTHKAIVHLTYTNDNGVVVYQETLDHDVLSEAANSSSIIPLPLRGRSKVQARYPYYTHVYLSIVTLL